MASHVVVIDTSLRRTTIKVNAGTFISDILDEACKKFGINASNFGLKNNNKPVDLSRTFRQTGLSSGAKLELVVASKSPSVVSIALQLPEAEAKVVPGGRLLDKFSSNTSLWMILRKFETSGTNNLNFTGRGIAQTDNGTSGAGRIFYETPVLYIMGRELSSFGDLQKTLAQIGLNSGSSLIRLSFRKTEQPLEEAMAEIGQHFQSVDAPVSPSAHASSIVNSQPATETESRPAINTIADDPNPDTSTTMAVDPPESSASSDNIPSALTPTTPSEASAPEELVVGPNQRTLSIFAAPSSSTPKAALNPHNDDDYEPTVAHAKLHQQSLLVRSHNQRLLSDAELQRQAEERAARQAAVKDVSIKVRFPDQLQVLSTFTTIDSASTLYDFVRGVMAADDQPFALVWMSPKGPKTIPNDPKIRLIKDLGFAGRVLVSFHWEDSASEEVRKKQTLKEEFANKAKELQIQDIAAAEAQNEEYRAASAAKVNEKEKEPGSGGKGKGVPKWLKLPGRK